MTLIELRIVVADLFSDSVRAEINIYSRRVEVPILSIASSSKFIHDFSRERKLNGNVSIIV